MIFEAYFIKPMFSDFLLCKKPQWYLCKDNETCLTSSFLCDNHTDCPHGDDESNCQDFEVYHVPTACSKFEFTCTDKMCVPLDLICDGKSDCLDNSDETIGCMDIEVSELDLLGYREKITFFFVF
jgi:Low-density lipoprotein receptor domain class A